jgi:hypothetical protein
MTYPPPPGQPPFPPSPGEPLPPPVDPYDSPQHTAPLYVQPDYGRPGYGQAAPTHPGYGQPVQPGYGGPDYPTAPPPPAATSRTVMIALLSAAIALVLLVGGGVAVYLIGENSSREKKDTVTQGTSPSAGPSPSAQPAPDGISISEPDTLNGHAKIEAKEFSSLTSELEKVLEGYPGAANAFGAVYGSPADKKMIAAIAAEVDIDDPQRMLDTVFQSFSGENQLTGVSPASTGSLGGVAQCGSTTVGKENMAICGWADEGSVGMFLFLYQTAVDVKGDFPDMRAEIETKD